MSERDVVVIWDIVLFDGKYRIQFEYGIIIGK